MDDDDDEPSNGLISNELLKEYLEFIVCED